MEQIQVFRFGEFVLDCGQRRLLRAGRDVYLPPKTFDLLQYLLRSRGRVITKDELLDRVWPDAHVVENTLAQRIREAREALGDGAQAARFIRTVPRVGYQFIAELEDQRPLGTDSSHRGPDDEASRGLSRARPAVIACALLALLSAIGYYFRSTPTAMSSGATVAITSIAVLPFRPLLAENRDPSLELGMADALIMKLGHLRQIAVRPLSAVRGYTGLAEDAVAAGQQLRVDSVLDGYIQRVQDRIRITVSLRRVRDGRQLWAGQFDELWTNVSTAQDLLSHRVAEALAITLTGDEQRQLTKRYTDNPEAYLAYARGRYFWNAATTEGYRKAVDEFELAIMLDPNYALAFAGLADSYNLMGSYGAMPMRQAYQKAKAAAAKAVDLDDQVAEAHTSLAAMITSHDWNWAEAEKHFRRAIDLKPQYATAHEWYSEYLSYMGQHAKAIGAARRALDLDPVSLRAISHVGLALYRARQYDAAIEHFREALDLNEDFADAHVMLGVTLVQTGRYGEAIAAFHRATALTADSSEILGLLGYAHGTAGRRREAQSVLETLDGLAGQNRYVSPFARATIYIGLGETDLAFEWLERSYRDRLWYMGLLAVDPLFDRLRADPRYADLLRRMNLPAAVPS